MDKAIIEAWSIRLEVESLEDYQLIDEMDLICDEPFMDRIISKYLTNGVISEDDREQMIGFYILVYCVEEIEID